MGTSLNVLEMVSVKFLHHWTNSQRVMSQKVNKKTTKKCTTENFLCFDVDLVLTFSRHNEFSMLNFYIVPRLLFGTYRQEKKKGKISPLKISYVLMLMSFWLFAVKNSKRHQYQTIGNFQWWNFPLSFLLLIALPDSVQLWHNFSQNFSNTFYKSPPWKLFKKCLLQ